MLSEALFEPLLRRWQSPLAPRKRGSALSLSRPPVPSRRAERAAALAAGARCIGAFGATGQGDAVVGHPVRTRPSGRVSPGANWMMPPPSFPGRPEHGGGVHRFDESQEPHAPEFRGSARAAPGSPPRPPPARLQGHAPAIAAREATEIPLAPRREARPRTHRTARIGIAIRHAGGMAQGGHNRREGLPRRRRSRPPWACVGSGCSFDARILPGVRRSLIVGRRP